MLSQINKKIYLIGVDSSDFLNCTLQSIEKIYDSNSLIISKKFNSQYIKFLEHDNRKIFIEENLSKKKGTFLWIKILKLLDNSNIIAHLINGDPFTEKAAIEEYDFFKKKGIHCEVIPGVITFIDRLNKGSNFLTDREKNSSATIINEYCKKKVTRLISNLFFEKLIILLKSKNQYNEILMMIKKRFPKNKLKINVVSRNKTQKQKSTSHMFQDSYIIIENNE